MTAEHGVILVRKATSDPPACSVILPAYNREAEIERAIRSVLAQSFADFELIIVDDASSDATVAAALHVVDPRVSIYRLTVNGGAPRARNAGVARARGTWIAFQDSDDEWRPTLLERHAGALSDASVGFSFCQLEQRYGAGVRHYPPAGYRPSASLRTDFLHGSIASTQTLATRRALFDAVGGFDEALHRFQDWDLVLRLSAQARGRYIPEPLAIAYESANSLTSSAAKGIAARSRILDKYADAFADEPAALARHCHILGRQTQKLGCRGDARAYFTRAVRARPVQIAGWARLAQTLLPLG